MQTWYWLCPLWGNHGWALRLQNRTWLMIIWLTWPLPKELPITVIQIWILLVNYVLWFSLDSFLTLYIYWAMSGKKVIHMEGNLWTWFYLKLSALSWKQILVRDKRKITLLQPLHNHSSSKRDARVIHHKEILWAPPKNLKAMSFTKRPLRP
jgi:hypothetical protein